MSRASIPPAFAASLSRDVYALTKLPTLDEALTSLNDDYGELFAFSKNNMLKGKTGGPAMIKCRTAFGFCLVGQKSLKGNAIILFRGTQYLADWLTNLNVGVSRSTGSQPVHDGFNQAFKTMKPKLMDFVTSLRAQGITNIHCIGHSLGGALATLCAEWLKTNCGFTPQLYTFGSPRVGLKGFSHSVTRSLGSDGVFRAYHKTDIVPCIPIWPFIHTPDDGTEYFLPSPGLMPGAEYHGMEHYVNSVGSKSWKALAAIKPDKKTDAGVIRWLKEDTIFSSTVSVIEWLNDALLFVLKKCLKGAEWIISSTLGTTLTLTDQLAFILHKGINLAKEISGWVVYLMKKILKFLGYSVEVDAAEMTATFIKATLIKLNQKLNIIASSALNKVLVEGRAV